MRVIETSAAMSIAAAFYMNMECIMRGEYEKIYYREGISGPLRSRNSDQREMEALMMYIIKCHEDGRFPEELIPRSLFSDVAANILLDMKGTSPLADIIQTGGGRLFALQTLLPFMIENRDLAKHLHDYILGMRIYMDGVIVDGEGFLESAYAIISKRPMMLINPDRHVRKGLWYLFCHMMTSYMAVISRRGTDVSIKFIYSLMRGLPTPTYEEVNKVKKMITWDEQKANTYHDYTNIIRYGKTMTILHEVVNARQTTAVGAAMPEQDPIYLATSRILCNHALGMYLITPSRNKTNESQPPSPDNMRVGGRASDIFPPLTIEKQSSNPALVLIREMIERHPYAHTLVPISLVYGCANIPGLSHHHFLEKGTCDVLLDMMYRGCNENPLTAAVVILRIYFQLTAIYPCRELSYNIDVFSFPTNFPNILPLHERYANDLYNVMGRLETLALSSDPLMESIKQYKGFEPNIKTGPDNLRVEEFIRNAAMSIREWCRTGGNQTTMEIFF